MKNKKCCNRCPVAFPATFPTPSPPLCRLRVINLGVITINDASPAASYPSSINVSDLPGTITQVTVTLNNMSHTFPVDIDILLVRTLEENVILV